jgi:hypothetical protein
LRRPPETVLPLKGIVRLSTDYAIPSAGNLYVW